MDIVDIAIAVFLHFIPFSSASWDDAKFKPVSLCIVLSHFSNRRISSQSPKINIFANPGKFKMTIPSQFPFLNGGVEFFLWASFCANLITSFLLVVWFLQEMFRFHCLSTLRTGLLAKVLVSISLEEYYNESWSNNPNLGSEWKAAVIPYRI